MPILAANMVNTVDPAFVLRLTRPGTAARQFKSEWGIHWVYLPSDHGGQLTIGFGTAFANDDAKLKVNDPSGKALGFGKAPKPPDDRGDPVSVAIPPGKRGSGWFTVIVHAPAGKYSLFAHFHERGVAREKDGSPLIPWNFWFFPFSNKDPEKTAYASEKLRPLHKYQKAFKRKGVVKWEKENHGDPDGKRESWEGHCDAASYASVIFQAPPKDGLTHNGVDFSCEELKLLATELASMHAEVGPGWAPFGQQGAPPVEQKPSAAPSDFGKPALLLDFLNILREEIRDLGHAPLVDLRDVEGKDPTQIWNHAVFCYHIDYTQAPGTDLSIADGILKLTGNNDFFDDGKPTGLPASPHANDVIPNKTAKQEIITFTVEFNDEGRFNEASSNNLWHKAISGKGEVHAPRHIAPLKKFDPTRFGDGNPLIFLEDILEILTLRSEFR